MHERLVELLKSKIELDPSGNVILKQLIQTDKQPPQWLCQNISAVARKADPTEEGSMNSENAFLLGVALSQGLPSTELRQRLQAGEEICLYQRPEKSGQGTS
jgi:hypothetical protein